VGQLPDEIAELRRELERAHEREAAVRDVIQTIASTTFDLDAVLQTVIDRAVELCHGDSGNISRRDGDVCPVVAFTSHSAEYERLVRKRVYRPERGSVMGPLDPRAAHRPDPGRPRGSRVRVAGDPEAGGYRTIMAVPLLRDGEPIGTMAIGRNEVRAFDEAEVRLAETFPDHVVIATENVRLFQTVERQRTELARFAPQVADLLSSDGGERLLAGHRREITALFCDLRGSRRSRRPPIPKMSSGCCAGTTPRSASSSLRTRAPSSTSPGMV
jgi:GAF domain-containing protein